MVNVLVATVTVVVCEASGLAIYCKALIKSTFFSLPRLFKKTAQDPSVFSISVSNALENNPTLLSCLFNIKKFFKLSSKSEGAVPPRPKSFSNHPGILLIKS